jgi:membrane-bound lytic murein transglycosylase D
MAREVSAAPAPAVMRPSPAAPLPLGRVTPQVGRYLVQYTTGGGSSAMQRSLERSRTMRGYAERVFREEGVPEELIWLAQVESGWRNDAVSPAAAAGVWQFIPRTAIRFGLRVEEGRDDRFDYYKQTRVAARYLRFLHDRYDGNWPLAIGAYNCGEANMDRAIERAGGVEDFWVVAQSGALPGETSEYVPKVLAACIVGSAPERFGLEG